MRIKPILLVFVCLFAFAFPTVAQEATVDPNLSDPPVTVIIEQPTDANDLLRVLTAVAAIAALAISIFAWFRAHPNATPAQLDIAVGERIDDLNQNRTAVEAYEMALQKQSEQFKMAFDTLTTLAGWLAIMIPSKALQEGSELLQDIRMPGAPAVTNVGDLQAQTVSGDSTVTTTTTTTVDGLAG